MPPINALILGSFIDTLQEEYEGRQYRLFRYGRLMDA